MLLVLDMANKLYEQQLRSGRADKTTYNAGWKVEELSRLNDEGRRLVVEMKVIVHAMQVDVTIDKSHKLYKICVDLTSFIKGKCVCLFVGISVVISFPLQATLSIAVQQPPMHMPF